MAAAAGQRIWHIAAVAAAIGFRGSLAAAALAGRAVSLSYRRDDCVVGVVYCHGVEGGEVYLRGGFAVVPQPLADD